MPLKRVNVVVEGTMFVPPDAADHPEHPIYIPVDPPPDSGLEPTHPIYLPVEPPGIWPPGSGIDMPDNTLPGDQPRPDHSLPGDQPRPDHTLPGDLPHAEHPIYLPVTPPDGAHPEHPIYIPVYPAHPIELPPDGGQVPPIEIGDLPPQLIEKLKDFMFGNLPPSSGGPAYPSPVQGQQRR